VPADGRMELRRERAAGPGHRGNASRRGRQRSDQARAVPGKALGDQVAGADGRWPRGPRTDGHPLHDLPPRPGRHRGVDHGGAQSAGPRGGHRPGAQRQDARNGRRRARQQSAPRHGHGRGLALGAVHRAAAAGRRGGRRVCWGENPRNCDGDRGRWGRSNGPGNGLQDDDQGTGSWGAGRRVGWIGLREVVQQLGQPPWVPQKEPSQHRLKSRGLPIGGSLRAARSAASPVAAATHQIPLLLVQHGVQALESRHLGLGPHNRHHGPVGAGGSGGLPAVEQALVEFPHRIAEPGQLLRTEISTAWEGGLHGQPGTGGWRFGSNGGLRLRRRRAGQGHSRGRASDGESPPGAPVSRFEPRGHCLPP